jgi:hypothetical protein
VLKGYTPIMKPDQNRHPTFFDLDAIRTGEGSAQDTTHVASCSTCQESLRDLDVMAAAFRRGREPIDVPENVDQRILWLARKQAAAIKRQKIGRSHPGVWSPRWAIAASLLVAIGAVTLWRWPRRPDALAPVGMQVARAQDIDGDGRVDILDAFTLARVVETQRADNSAWDFDHDGRVDRGDVNAIAAAAVALGES